MWEMKILGVDLYHVLAWFWLYSFCGWIWESSYVSIRQKKLVNRGFVNGPLLTLYGTGAVMVYLILRPFEAILLFLHGIYRSERLGTVFRRCHCSDGSGICNRRADGDHFSCALVGLQQSEV